MYEWVLVAHIISVISWMVGLLYLPRLFVYHSTSEMGSQQSETFKIMERRLLKAIMTPAMISSWVFGLWLVWLSGYFSSGWFHFKFLLVLLLSAFHMYCAVLVKQFSRDENKRTDTFYRFLNEFPTIIMILTVILVVVKPF